MRVDSLAVERTNPVVNVVTYHHIAAEEADDVRGLRVTTRPEVFASHLAYYERNFDIIDLATLLNGPLPKRPLLLTFDDFYQSIVHTATNVLKPRGIPALFCISANVVGRSTLSLDNVLASACNTVGVEHVTRFLGQDTQKVTDLGSLISTLLPTCSVAQRESLFDSLLLEFGDQIKTGTPSTPVVTVSDFPVLRAANVDIGNHSADHVHARGLNEDDLQAQIAQGRFALERMSGSSVESFSVAYGHQQDLTPNVMRAIRESGHRATFLVHARSNWLRPEPDVWFRFSYRHEPVRRVRFEVRVLSKARVIKTALRR
jgi:peptidoglycan/xylan/chitin deacetylase (PgdA/CDA1 family)